MNTPNYFEIVEVLNEVTYLHPTNETKVAIRGTEEDDGQHPYIIDRKKLQTDPIKDGWQDYGYFLKDEHGRLLPTARIHAYLQGGLACNYENNKIARTDFLQYQFNTLKLLLGMYVFIDTTNIDNAEREHQVPYYLLGPMKSKRLKPTFNFRCLEARSIPPTSTELRKRLGEEPSPREPDDQWLQFFLAYNEFTREGDVFSNQDFVRLFNYPNYKLKRRSDLEKRHHVAYVCSGEMDHCILQYLSLYISYHPTNHEISSGQMTRRQGKKGPRQVRTGFSINTLSPELTKFLLNHKEFMVADFRKSGQQISLENRKFHEWLQRWGMIDRGRMTVKMVKAIDWFYQYLESAKDVEGAPKEYLVLLDRKECIGDYWYFGEEDLLVRTFIREWRQFRLPSSAKSKRDIKGEQADEMPLVDLYLELLLSHREFDAQRNPIKNPWEQFAKRCRFRPFVHFVFRYLRQAFPGKQAETCGRGLIISPILSRFQNEQNNLQLSSSKLKNNNDIEYVGYFIGHVLEDYKFNNFQCHPTDTYLTEFKQIINYLGRIEIDRIYFKGIINTYQKNAIKQAKLSAIASCMSRNLSHTTGSHKTPWFKNFWNIYLKELKEMGGSDWNLPPYIKKALESLRKISAQTNTLSKTKKMEGIKLIESHLLNYFDFVNDNMEFIADVTTGGDVKKVTFNYAISDFYEEYQKLRLMHHGLFDDRDMDVHIDFDNSNLQGNQYSTAEVSIPNGQLGKTAFYVILENIIRNYYKHSHQATLRPKFRLKVTPVEALHGMYWAIDFYDVIHDHKNSKMRTADLLQRINKNFINRSITRSDGTLRSEGWGYIEMKACCAYLINFPMHQLDLSPNKEGRIETEPGEAFFPLIEANYYTDSGRIIANKSPFPTNCNLGYRFYLKRAQKIGISDTFEIGANRPGNVSLKSLLNKIGNSGIVPIAESDLRSNKNFELFVSPQKSDDMDANQRCLIPPKDFDPWGGTTAWDIEVSCWRAFIDQQYPAFDKTFQIAANKEELSALTRRGVPQSSIVFIDDHARFSSQRKYQVDELRSFLWYLPDELRTSRDISLVKESVANIYSRTRLIETLNTGIAVFDERIQQETLISYNNNPGIDLRDVHRCANIYIPDEKFDLSSERVIPLLETEIARQFESADYVILHFTLFEKMVEGDSNAAPQSKKDLDRYYERLQKKLSLRERGKVLVFCSGRGRPSNLISNCYYIHLSTLQYFTIRTISKCSLVNVLRSLRQT